MILLDTNVISELWKAAPAPAVLTWMDEQEIETCYLSVVTVAELRFGIAAMPDGRRRTIFHDRLEGEVLPAFAGRVLTLDLDATAAYAGLRVRAKNACETIGQADGFIAAMAALAGFAVATRDTRPFEAAGVRTINPWQL